MKRKNRQEFLAGDMVIAVLHIFKRMGLVWVNFKCRRLISRYGLSVSSFFLSLRSFSFFRFLLSPLSCAYILLIDGLLTLPSIQFKKRKLPRSKLVPKRRSMPHGAGHFVRRTELVQTWQSFLIKHQSSHDIQQQSFVQVSRNFSASSGSSKIPKWRYM